MIEKRYVRPDGSSVWVANRVSAVADAAGRPQYVLAVCQDMTARKQAEEALKEAGRRKDEFLAMLAHELRNPLAPIRNAVQILRFRAGDPPSVERVRERIDRQVQHLARLVDDSSTSRVSPGVK